MHYTRFVVKGRSGIRSVFTLRSGIRPGVRVVAAVVVVIEEGDGQPMDAAD